MTPRETKRTEPRRPRTSAGDEEGLRFTRWTGIFAAAGTAFAGAGFYLLAQESINLAPVLLLIGFLVFFPLAVIR